LVLFRHRWRVGKGDWAKKGKARKAAPIVLVIAGGIDTIEAKSGRQALGDNINEPAWFALRQENAGDSYHRGLPSGQDYVALHHDWELRSLNVY
jgi:hypothetical protein